VFLNTMKSAERSRMDAAHELGHLVMHFWSGTGRGGDPTELERREGTRTAEDEAKRFAAAFLMPERSVLASAPRFPSVEAVVQAKRKWNVAAVALAYRMRTVGLLSEWHARSLMIEMAKLGYRTEEPNPIAHESSQLLGKVLRELRSKGMATVDLARDLNTPVEELNHVMFGLVLTPVSGTGDGSRTPADSMLQLAPRN
jgi:Zn-dependent peptidase ImmA (M78 family)